MAKVILTESELVTHIKDCWKVSDDHWKQYEKNWWDLSWQLYENKQDYSDKKAWQAKTFWPKTEGTVDTIRALVKRGMPTVAGEPTWFTVEGRGESDRDDNKPVRLKKIVSTFLNFIGFTSTLLSCIRTSLITSIAVVKTYSNPGLVEWIDGKPTDIWEPFCGEVDPYDIRFSRDMMIKKGKLHGTYAIERIEKDYTDLALEAEGKDYNIDKVRVEDFPKEGEKQKAARDQMKEKESETNILNPVEIKEFHGFIRVNPNKKKQIGAKGSRGETIYTFNEIQKYVITLVNDKNLIRVSGQTEGKPSYPDDNQDYVYYILRPLLRRADEVYGKSLVKSIATLQLMLNNIWNLNLDNANWTINKLFGIDVTGLDNPDESIDLEPGGRIFTNRNVNEVIQELLKGSLPSESQWIPMAIEQAMDRHTGVTPSTEAGISTPGVNTATEFAGLMQQSVLKAEDFGEEVERQASVILNAITGLVLTMPDEYKWMAQEILESDPKDVFELSAKFDTRISGISGLINKIQTQNKLLALLQILGPLAAPLGINVRPIVKGIIRANEDIFADTKLEEIFPDVPMIDLNTIMGILSKINPALPPTFMFVLQQMQTEGSKGGGQQGGLMTDLKTGAQPSTGGVNQTSMNPLNWAAGGGPQG